MAANKLKRRAGAVVARESLGDGESFYELCERWLLLAQASARWRQP
ncbi:MAG: hypothetical protein ACI93T_000217, partial [Porticoccaceae bacterium]